MTVRTLNVPLKGFGASPTDAEVQLAVLDPGDRVKRAAVVFLAFILIAVGAIPIPLVHLVMVPLALLLAFGFAANGCASGRSSATWKAAVPSAAPSRPSP